MGFGSATVIGMAQAWDIRRQVFLDNQKVAQKFKIILVCANK